MNGPGLALWVLLGASAGNLFLPATAGKGISKMEKARNEKDFMIRNDKIGVAMAFVAGGITAVVLAGCGNSGGAGSSALPTDGRIVTVSSAVTLSQKNTPDAPVPYEGPLTGGAPVDFEYIAQIKPPFVGPGGKDVQATSIKRITKNRIVVTYNTAGAEISGAIDVFDFSDPRKPKIESSTHFKNLEFSDVIQKDNILLASGNSADGAIVAILDLRNSKKPEDLGTISLPGYTATSITVYENKAFVTTADAGGLSVLDIKNAAKPNVLVSGKIERASHVTLYKDIPIVSADDGSAQLFAFTDAFNPLASLPKGLASEAPARLFNQGNFLVTNASPNFVSVFSYEKLPYGLVELDHTEIPGRGNGLFSKNYVSLLAQGDAGLVWADHRGIMAPAPSHSSPPAGALNPIFPNERTVIRGSFDFADDDGSANQVYLFSKGNGEDDEDYGDCDDKDNDQDDDEEDDDDDNAQKDKFILLADGLGGLRWIAVNERTLLRASKNYRTQVSFADSRYFLDGHQYKVPSYLKVTAGNAANQFATLEFDDVVCFYKGGAGTTHPVYNSSDWDRGLKYNFVSCSNGQRSGSKITSTHRVQMNIQNGHPDYSPTTAEVQLEKDD